MCGGDNSTCADCAGVPKGKSKRDNCEVCLLESDAAFDTGCSVFGEVKPVSGETGAATVVTLRGAGYQKLILTGCQFNNSVSAQK